MRSTLLPVILIASSSLQPPAASAQDAEPDTALEQIVVTAQRREQSAIDVPIAMSVMTEETLQAMGADDFMDFARTVPGLQFRANGPGRTKLAMRGISSATGSATVGYYIDDVPLPANNGFINLVTIDPKILDIERVEVLRGPQGTLYGTSSMGGTIKFVTNRPDSTTFGAKVGLTTSTTTHGGENIAADAVLNAPIIPDQLAVRLVGYYRFDDGYIDRVFGPSPGEPFREGSLVGRETKVASERAAGARAVVEYTPVEDTRLAFSVFHQSLEMDGLPYIDGPPGNPEYDRIYRQLVDDPEPFSDEFTLYDLTLDMDLGNVNLTAIAGRFERKFNMTESGTQHLDVFFFTPFGGPLFPAPLEEITDHVSETYEVRLSTIEPFHGFHGLFGIFKQERIPLRGANWIVPGVNAAYEPLGLTIPEDNFFTSTTTASADESAIFGELTYQILPEVTATAGVRFFDLESSSTTVSEGVFAPTGPPETVSFDSTEVNYKFALMWEPSDTQSLYASAAEGLRPGFGIRPLPDLCDPFLIERGLDPDNPPSQVGPDSVWSYEIGAKSMWLDRRLAVDAAVFHVDWSEIQQTVVLGCGFNIVANAGEARSQGVELELSVTPVDGLDLRVAAAYTDATLLTDAPDVGGEKGDRIQNVPEWQASGSARYGFPINDGYSGFLRADAQYTGDSFVSFDTDNPLHHLPSYTLVNFRAGIETPGGWDFVVFVDNAFDETALVSLPDSLIFNLQEFPRFAINRPRTIGISVRRNFGL